MKICYLANAASIHTYRWVTCFAKKGHQVYLISLKSPKFDYGEVRVFLIKKLKHTPKITSHFINFLPVFLQTKRLLKKIDFDILHVISVAGEGWLGALAGFHPLMITAGGTDVLTNPKESIIYKTLTKYTLKKADLITCDGEITREAMINLEADHKKIKTIRFGVDVQKFKSKEGDEILKEKLFAKNSKIVISSKPLRVECDIKTFIKAIPEVLKKVPEVKFVIVGEGEQKEYLVNLANSLGISNSIKFVGWISSEELPSYLNLADVFVSTSLVDSGLATSTAEAMACELPVIITDLKVNKDWIKDGENGFIFPCGDSKTLAEKTIYLLKNENLRTKFAKINRKMIEEKKNYYKEMEKVEDLYKELVNSYKK